MAGIDSSPPTGCTTADWVGKVIPVRCRTLNAGHSISALARSPDIRVQAVFPLRPLKETKHVDVIEPQTKTSGTPDKPLVNCLKTCIREGIRRPSIASPLAEYGTMAELRARHCSDVETSVRNIAEYVITVPDLNLVAVGRDRMPRQQIAAIHRCDALASGVRAS